MKEYRGLIILAKFLKGRGILVKFEVWCIVHSSLLMLMWHFKKKMQREYKKHSRLKVTQKAKLYVHVNVNIYHHG